jgi:hypothetical protein
MTVQDGHDFFEATHVVVDGEQRSSVFVDVLGGADGFFVCSHPVEYREDDLPESGHFYVRIVLM